MTVHILNHPEVTGELLQKIFVSLENLELEVQEIVIEGKKYKNPVVTLQ